MMNRGRFVPVAAFALVISATASAATLHVPGQHATIQAAVDAAVPGDSILIAPGTYAPFTVTTDDLTIRAASEDSNPVILIPGYPLQNAVGITIDADRVTVEGLTADGLTNFALHSVGFRVTGDDNTLRGNHAIPLFPLGSGFESLSCNRTVFDGNSVSGLYGPVGFKAVGCTDERYLQCVYLHGGSMAFQQTACTDQIYKQNAAYHCGAGFQCTSTGGPSTGTTYKENLVEPDPFGIGFGLIGLSNASLKENTVMNGYAGIWLTASNGNELRDNLVTGSHPGSGFILDGGSDENDLRGNVSTGNSGFGFRVTELLDNSFRDNEADDNGMGGSNQPGIVD